ncbi:hypothetical protein [uncultured Psychroserpens sp.]|nr:hypothetical protein [uncultured Psychroserpens sp.]
MKKFTKFKIENTNLIFGGDHLPTEYPYGTDGIGKDFYDDVAHALVFIEP